ncbi:MAG: hypothetical protein QM715_18660 [Nibricoccus sp.]
MTRQSFIAAAGGVAGWAATFSLPEFAASFAALATGVWMITQTVLAIRRQRCTDYTCKHRKP